MNPTIAIQQSFGGVELDRIRSLRYAILREPLGLPSSDSIFQGDDDPSTIHLLALDDAELIGCATMLASDSDAIQLRGMAVADDWQGQGIGKQIVDAAKVIAKAQHKSLWCNARFSAIGFYERLGWVQSGSLFDVPVIGSHAVMKWTESSQHLSTTKTQPVVDEVTSPERLASSPRPLQDVVLYDGKCNFCRSQIDTLRRLDGAKRLEFVSLHDPRVAVQYPNLTFEQMMEQMWIVAPDGKQYGGAYAVRYLTLRLPILWPIAPLMYIPFSMPVWSFLYRQVAKRRYRIAGKNCDDDGTCSLHQ
jgi:predicted DCC family thiol-disulfide oxidoreductase YuxK/GNAT superfamily N-acetyltransferase